MGEIKTETRCELARVQISDAENLILAGRSIDVRPNTVGETKTKRELIKVEISDTKNLI